MQKKTVFVIGAGASKEAKLPTGIELKDIIAKLLDIRFNYDQQVRGDYAITQALRMHEVQPNGQPGDINPYLHEAWHIRDAMPSLANSIDTFIDNHRNNDKIALCGKLAIVKSILEAEKKSSLYVDVSNGKSNISINALNNTWYLPFFRSLTESCGIDEIEDRLKSTTLIVFNYDRCIEHFLFHALQLHYRISNAEAGKLVSNLNIYHPYGMVGHLPWQQNIERRHITMEFGVDPNAEELLLLAGNIKTFTEGTDPNSSEISEIHSHMNNAERLVFLGFAFHKLNIELITPKTTKDKYATLKCYASTYKISESDKEVIREQICGIYKRPIDIRMANVTCHDFFTEFWRSLGY